MKNKILLFCLLSLLFLKVKSQTRIIEGVVLGAKEETVLVGVNVVLQGTKKGTLTDIDGRFELEIPESWINKELTIIFNYVGYKRKELKIKIIEDRIILFEGSHNVRVYFNFIRVKLEEGEGALEEVIITGGMESSKSHFFKKIADKKGSRLKEAEYLEVAEMDEETEIEAGIANSDTKAGSLTAGEVHDFSKWVLWKDISAGVLKKRQKEWTIKAEERYAVQIQTNRGRPIAGARVKLFKNKDVLWEAVSDNTGKAELWTNIFDEYQTAEKLRIEVLFNNEKYEIKRVTEFHKGINTLKIQENCNTPAEVDIAFVVDATASMQDEINYLKAELEDVIQRSKDTLPYRRFRFASVFYRDKTDEYLTKEIDFTSENKTLKFIKENNADGGGDYPEAVDEALEVAINKLNWNEKAVSKILFLVLDAPPHSEQNVINRLKLQIKQAAEKGIRIVPLTCSGTNKSTEYLMRCFALATNGTYLFLTDDSGIGGGHIKPTTDKYDVEKLNSLLLKTIYNFCYMPSCKEMNEIKEQDSVVVAERIEIKNNETETNDEKEIRWTIYPNPTSGVFSIELTGGEIEHLFISDLSGKILKRVEVDKKEKVRVDMSAFPTGIYLVRYLYNEDKWLTAKILVVHE